MTPPGQLDQAFVDRWIERSLRECYAALLREPLPDALTSLLQPTAAPR